MGRIIKGRCLSDTWRLGLERRGQFKIIRPWVLHDHSDGERENGWAFQETVQSEKKGAHDITEGNSRSQEQQPGEGAAQQREGKGGKDFTACWYTVSMAYRDLAGLLLRRGDE